MPALATIAAATERARIGTFVLNNDLRHAAVLAQDLATLDVLSRGRLEIGIGAGWNAAEYAAIGVTFDRPGRRIERMAEAVANLKGLFGGGLFSFQARTTRSPRWTASRKPVQRSYPPFLIGGGGRRVLTIAARGADTVGLAPIAVGGPKALAADCLAATAAEKIALVREAAGERFDRLDLNVYPAVGPVRVTNHARREATRLAWRLASRCGADVSADQLLEFPFVLIGSFFGLAANFRGARERFGINSITVFDMDQFAPVVERLAGT